MIVITQNATYGIYKTVEELDNFLLCDGTIELPKSVIGTYEISIDDSLMPAPADSLPLPILKADFVKQIDDKVAAIIEKWGRFQMGYAKREAAARAFKAANYIGDATRWVTSFADSSGKTAREATDIIIGQADGMAVALENIEALRMEKYLIIRAETKAIADAEFTRINEGIDAIVSSLS